MRAATVVAALALLIPAPAALAAQPPVNAVSMMVAFTTTSDQTLDMRGIEPSMYRGAFFRKSAEHTRLCIIKRESEGEYDVVSHNGYRGAYQVSKELARGVTWMMLDEHEKLLGADNAKHILAKLRDLPMNKWPRYWQDAAFHTIFNWERTGSGARHWAGGRWHC